MSTPLLILENLYTAYGHPSAPIPILRGLSLTLHPAQSLAITGVSGSGKSTLLHVIAGLHRPDSGHVSVNGQNPYALDDPQLALFRSQQIGLIFQEHFLLEQLSALENILVARLALGKVTPAHRQRALDLLHSVGLKDRLHHLPAQLSGGERQRVALARALMNQPPLVLADEPTGSLDERTAHDVADLLLLVTRQQNASLVVVTHSPALAQRLHRTSRLSHGLLLEDPPP